jgi:hypothetical protein
MTLDPRDLPRDLHDPEAPFPGLSALRETTPPPSLVPAVMRRIAEPQPFSLWRWLRRPLDLRVTPVSLAAAAGLGALVLVALLSRGGAHRGAGHVAAAPADSGETVMVRFVLVAKGAKQVALAGDFNAWQPEATALENADGQGTFVATVPLKKGAYEYMFLVDGKWVTDPSAAEHRPDGFGRRNGVLRL